MLELVVVVGSSAVLRLIGASWRVQPSYRLGPVVAAVAEQMLFLAAEYVQYCVTLHIFALRIQSAEMSV